MKREWRRLLSSGCGGNSEARGVREAGIAGPQRHREAGDACNVPREEGARRYQRLDKDEKRRRQAPNTRLFALNRYHVNPCSHRFTGPSRQAASSPSSAQLNSLMLVLGKRIQVMVGRGGVRVGAQVFQGSRYGNGREERF